MKLSSSMIEVLFNAAYDRDLFAGCRGRSQFGGRTQTIRALKDRGLLTERGNITVEGAKVARRILREQRRAPTHPGAATGRVTRRGYLKKDRLERFNSKRSWWVNAWRIVDEDDNDLVQPWSSTKQKARETAKALGIELIELQNTTV